MSELDGSLLPTVSIQSSLSHLPLMGNRTTNLPSQLTAFIGRQHDMAEVKHLLSLVRLLTLSGPGGCGKTRFAIQVASELLERFADGVWLVELAKLSDMAFVPHAVAHALGVGERPGQSMTETLVDYLRHRALLLVLDNCEHVIEACAELSEMLLRHCPHLRLLTTSREALNITGETPWLVGPLSLTEAQSAGHLPSLEHLMQYEAIRLFVERAATAWPTFTLTVENAMAVTQVCHRLDGIPLAIELAAARMKMLSVQQVAARLDDRFHLLTAGSRTALPRQRTLLATMDWSYDLLSAKEQAVFRRLAVFTGGFTLEAAEAVCAGDGLVEQAEVLDLLAHLVNKSLVVVEQHGSETRYRLLETTRQYGKEKLQDGNERADTHRRHRDWYLSLVERAQPMLKGAGQQSWLDRLEMEHDNLRASLEWSLEQGSWETLMRIATALSDFWSAHSHFREGRRWLEASLANSEELPLLLRARALNATGALTALQGEYMRACTFHERSLDLFKAVEDDAGIAISLHHLGYIAERRGNYEQARALLQESLTLFRELGDAWGIALVANRLGGIAGKQGNAEEIMRLYKESLALRRELGDSIGLAQSLHNLGYMYTETSPA